MTPPGALREAAGRVGRPSRRAAATVALLLQAAAFGTAAVQPPPDPLRTVERLDVPRYMGTWYEIAKFPNRVQAQCASDTVAVYTAQPDGTVRVVNRCRYRYGQQDHDQLNREIR